MSIFPLESVPRVLSSDEAGIRFVPPPIGVCNDKVSGLLVGDHLREIALFVGQKNSLGDFVAHGTAFTIYKETYGRAITFLVTAKHVFDDIPGNDVLLRANGKGKSGIKYVALSKAKWHFHPGHRQHAPRQNYIDVAVYEVDFSWTDLEVVVVAADDVVDDDFIDKYSIGTGDEVAIAGLFHSHIGTVQNVPIIRTGNIAAMRGEPVPSSCGMMDGYLIESRSIGGVSGSPVFLNMSVRPEEVLPPYDRTGVWAPKKIEKAPKPYRLLGLVHGYYTLVDQHEWVSKTDQQVGDINTGISIVVPVEKVIETINPVFERSIEMAKILDETVKRRSGVKSASSVSPLASDENPTHREDFNRLLGVAARTPPQDD